MRNNYDCKRDLCYIPRSFFFPSFTVYLRNNKCTASVRFFYSLNAPWGLIQISWEADRQL